MARFGLVTELKGARAADLINSHQVIEGVLGDDLGIKTVLKHAIGICNCDHGQAVRLVLVPDSRLQGIDAIVVPVAGNQDRPLSLASSPNQRVRRVVR